MGWLDNRAKVPKVPSGIGSTPADLTTTGIGKDRKMGIRIATALLSRRIYAGYPNKKGDGFRGKRYDVTSDCLRAVVNKVEPGHSVTVEVDGQARFEISVRELE